MSKRQFPNNTTINYAVNTDYSIVGYASGSVSNGFQTPSSPTVGIGNGGSIPFNLNVYNSSIVDMGGGNIGGMLAYDNSIVNMSGGNVLGVMQTFNSSVTNMSGGHVSDHIVVRDNGIFNLSGGSTTGVNGLVIMGVLSGGTVNIFGDNLTASLIDGNNDGGFDSLYSLSGTLQDGTLLNNKNIIIQNGTGRHSTCSIPPPRPRLPPHSFS